MSRDFSTLGMTERLQTIRYDVSTNLSTHAELLQLSKNKASLVSIMTRLRDARPGFDSWHGQERVSFFFTTASRPVLGPTQPPIQWVPWVPCPGKKRLGREADHSPPSSTEVRNVWNYTSTTPCAFMAWYFVKHKDNITLPFPLPSWPQDSLVTFSHLP
jgi:hypothetical protein